MEDRNSERRSCPDCNCTRFEIYVSDPCNYAKCVGCGERYCLGQGQEPVSSGVHERIYEAVARKKEENDRLKQSIGKDMVSPEEGKPWVLNRDS